MTAAPPIRPDHTRDFTLTWGGVDWDAVAWYDVCSEPREATMTDPPEYLELDVWRIVLRHWYGPASDQALPGGIWIEPTAVPPDTLARIVEDCAQDWHDCHSRSARADQAADDARDAAADAWHEREP